MPRGKFTINIYRQNVEKGWKVFFIFEKSNFAENTKLFSVIGFPIAKKWGFYKLQNE